MYGASNAVEELKLQRKYLTVEEMEVIEDALRYFGII